MTTQAQRIERLRSENSELIAVRETWEKDNREMSAENAELKQAVLQLCVSLNGLCEEALDVAFGVAPGCEPQIHARVSRAQALVDDHIRTYWGAARKDRVQDRAHAAMKRAKVILGRIREGRADA